MMNDAEMQQAIRDAHDATRTQPMLPRSTERLQALRPHEHSFQVVTGLTTLRFCTTCGKSWLMQPAHHNFQHVLQWQAILETD